MTDQTDGGLQPQADTNLTPEAPTPVPAAEVQPLQPLQPPTGPDQVLTSTPAPGAIVELGPASPAGRPRAPANTPRQPCSR